MIEYSGMREREMPEDMKVYVMGGGGLASIPTEVLQWAIAQRSPGVQMAGDKGIWDTTSEYWGGKLRGYGDKFFNSKKLQAEPMETQEIREGESMPQEQYGEDSVRTNQEKHRMMQELMRDL